MITRLAYVLAACTALSAGPQAHYQFYSDYNYLTSCQACHVGANYKLNQYGKDIKEAGKLANALKKIAQKDSDGDGQSNASEILKKTNPGSKKNDPNWLKSNKLPPVELVKKFPRAQSWAIKRANITQEVIENDAKKMGVKLELNDKNFVFIPLKNRKPLGMGVVYPFYLNRVLIHILVVVDPQLKVKTVIDLSNKLNKKQKRVLTTIKGTSYKVPVFGTKEEIKIKQAIKDAGVVTYLAVRRKR